MDWFVADTHFGHEKMRSRRGFASVSEMDEALIAAWNARVGETDDVFIAGDLICHSERPAAEYLRRLKGRKHLAVGNHDRAWMREVTLGEWFVEVALLLEVARPGRFVTVGHYPMMDWFRRRHGGPFGLRPHPRLAQGAVLRFPADGAAGLQRGRGRERDAPVDARGADREHGGAAGAAIDRAAADERDLTMTRRDFLRALGLAMAVPAAARAAGPGGVAPVATSAANPFGLPGVGRRPNIILVLCDGGKFVGALREKIAENPEAFPADVVPEDAFTPAQFERINRADSPISFLIGSKKFTEGWSSWRVSTMGLLNVGVNEGTQIIQLFGRGVRLRGENFSLKRSTEAERRRENADFLRQVETLRIFGVRSAYMEKFKEYLSEEGVAPEKDMLQMRFEPMRNLPDGVKLKTLCVADGYRLTQKNGFRARESAVLCEISEEDGRTLKLPVAEYNDFSFVQSFSSDGRGAESGTRTIPEAKLDLRAFPFFDWDGIYRELMTYKARCGYWNLRLEKEKIVNFCSTRADWYRLCTRADDVKFDSFEKLPKLEELFKKLLFNYVDKFYKAFQARYESGHMTTRELSGNEIPEECAFEIENSETGRQWAERLKQLKALVENRSVPAEFNRWSSDDFVAIAFPRHLYSPLLYARDGKALPFRMKPLSFDAPSEFRFVRDLQAFYENPANAGCFRGVDMYLMRNAAKASKGIGFAQAGNFYPDFLLWLVDKESGKQFLTFVDPKGIRNLKRDDAKLNFYKEIKTLQRTVRKETGTAELTLNCVILSATKFEDVLFDGTQEELEAANILFLDDGGASYLPKLLAKAREE